GNLRDLGEDVPDRMALTNNLSKGLIQLKLLLQINIFSLKLILPLLQFVVGPTQFLFRLSSIGDVDTRTDVAKKIFLRRKTWRTRVKNPTIFPIRSAQSVLHLEWLFAVERGVVDFEDACIVIRVYSLGPTSIYFFL